MTTLDAEQAAQPICLIVNADDFGRSTGINRGIIRAHERGIVTSASLMVRWPAAADACAYGRSRPQLDLGLHVDLSEWEHVDDAWRPVYEVVGDDPADIEREVRQQLGEFRKMTGHDPTHLDSHQHVHRNGGAAEVMSAVAAELGVTLRERSPHVTYCGRFYGQSTTGGPWLEGITVEALAGILASLPPGWNELGCHPGFAEDLDNAYAAEREIEVETLCSARVRETIDQLGIRLGGHRDVHAPARG